MFKRFTRFITAPLVSVTLLHFAAQPTLALGGLTAEEEVSFWALILVTVGSSMVAAAVSLYHYWNSERDEWSAILHSTAVIALVTLASLYLSLMPVLHRVDLIQAIFGLYLPSVLLGSMLVAAGMWLRTLCHSGKEMAAHLQHVKEYLQGLRKDSMRKMREKRIQRAQVKRRKELGVNPSYDQIDSGEMQPKKSQAEAKARPVSGSHVRPPSGSHDRKAIKA